MGDAWDRTPHDRGPDHAVRHSVSGRPADRFALGAHPPTLSPEDVERIHALWVDAVKAVGPHVHHRDIVVAALDSFEAELHASRERVVDRLRRQVRP